MGSDVRFDGGNSSGVRVVIRVVFGPRWENGVAWKCFVIIPKRGLS